MVEEMEQRGFGSGIGGILVINEIFQICYIVSYREGFQKEEQVWVWEVYF